MMERDDILRLDDAGLSAVCELEFFKGTGPGGQKRNKTSSAVRVSLPAWNVTATDCTERSQTRNRANALRKLRLELAMTRRISPAQAPGRMSCALTSSGYPLWLARVLDVFGENASDPRRTAAQLGISTSSLIKTFYRDPLLWQRLQQELSRQGLPLLRAPK
ncbi:MAG: peptide chain release factor-like protein [Lentisphaeria bacterium]|nr:peptide chain release factor-like protein [Lentisphaeria bacterium]